MTKGNVLVVTKKIGSSPNLETLYLAGELISLITTGSHDEKLFIKVSFSGPTHMEKVGELLTTFNPVEYIFFEKEEPQNYQAVMKYLKNIGQFPIMGKKQEDSNPLVV